MVEVSLTTRLFHGSGKLSKWIDCMAAFTIRTQKRENGLPVTIVLLLKVTAISEKQEDCIAFSFPRTCYPLHYDPKQLGFSQNVCRPIDFGAKRCIVPN